MLISLALISFMFIGFAGSELYAIRETRANLYFFIATNQLENILERLKASRGLNIETQQLIWNKDNAQALPQGVGSIVKESSLFSVTIFWGGYKAPCMTAHLGVAGCIHDTISL